MVPFFLLACVETILSQYPSPTYQDIMVQDQIVAVGTNSCAPRYERIKPVFDSFQKPFKVLEIGAAQGYFSFRIAQEYPQASCVMIEEDNHHYGYHGSLLEELCHLNNHLKNVSLIQKNINVSDLESIDEHFDVIMAFLVIHQMHPSFDEQKKILDVLLTLGTHVLIEVASDVAPLLSTYTAHLCKKRNCEYLGSVKRYKDPNAMQIGEIYWFKN